MPTFINFRLSTLCAALLFATLTSKAHPQATNYPNVPPLLLNAQFSLSGDPSISMHAYADPQDKSAQYGATMS